MAITLLRTLLTLVLCCQQDVDEIAVNLHEITVEKIKFRPIVDQKSTETYDTSKLNNEYLKSFVCNKCKINDCLKFLDMIKALPSLQKK